MNFTTIHVNISMQNREPYLLKYLENYIKGSNNSSDYNITNRCKDVLSREIHVCFTMTSLTIGKNNIVLNR